PTGFHALFDDRPVRAMVKVKRCRDGSLAGHLLEHQLDEFGAHGLDGLHRHLDNDRRLHLRGGGKDRVHGQVVDDIECPNSVSPHEGSTQDFLHRHDWHNQTSLLTMIPHARWSWTQAQSGKVELSLRQCISRSGMTDPKSQIQAAKTGPEIRTQNPRSTVS